jgi:S-adenosylmethionine:tRNA ribosyltransferase-isomerase
MMTQTLNNGQRPEDLLLSSYDYQLPSELIASRPAVPRDHSRLMVYDQAADKVTHTTFNKLSEFIPAKSTLVFNQSKVFPCRLLGKKKSGGKSEVFILSTEKSGPGYPCLIKTTNKKRIGDEYYFDHNISAQIVGVNEEGSFQLSFSEDLESVLEKIGKMPIPPYIRKGESDQQDLDDYQTLYAKHIGSVAAPTAGLHFSRDLFNKLDQKEINRHYVTLHVGRGTFAPVKVENLNNHQMHTENYFVEEDQWSGITKSNGVFAVGTTTLRVLESLWQERDRVKALHNYKTDIFLYPGKEIQSIQGLLTNFHLPQSTLLILISALIGREKTLELYRLAVQEKYRFFSYGDAMLIIRGHS